MNFSFVFYLAILLVVVFQDFKRREIDDWLNLFLFFSGISFLFFSDNVFFSSAVYIEFAFFIFIACLLCFLLYNFRFFSGGDAKLFFAMSPLFFSVIFYNALFNLLVFFICLAVCGCVYSLIYSGILFVRDYTKTRKAFVAELNKKYSKILLLVCLLFLVMGLWNIMSIFMGAFVFLFILLFSFAKSLENVSMKKNISTKDLREGDWLFYDLKIGNRTFKKNWDGLSEKDVAFLKRFNKNVVIKDGIPYAPAFFMALILYFFSSYLIGIIFP